MKTKEPAKFKENQMSGGADARFFFKTLLSPKGLCDSATND